MVRKRIYIHNEDGVESEKSRSYLREDYLFDLKKMEDELYTIRRVVDALTTEEGLAWLKSKKAAIDALRAEMKDNT